MRLTRVAMVLIWTGLALFHSPVVGQEFRIGIIADSGPSEGLGNLLGAIRAEVQKTMGSTRTVVMDSSQIFPVNWEAEQARKAYERLNNRCDLILLVGSISTNVALETKEFTTPTIGLGIFAPQLQGIPLTEQGTSGRKNFTYILDSQDILADLTQFSGIAKFKELGFLYLERTVAWMDGKMVAGLVEQWETELDANISLIPLDANDVERSLSQLPPEIDAVFLSIPFEIRPENAQTLAEGLIQKKIPSFAINKAYVDAGILAGNADDKILQQILRKVAIMADEAAQKQDLGETPVGLRTNKELFLNMVTARRIDYSPPFELIFTANIVGDQSKIDRKILSLPQILQMGLNENLGIKISEQDIALTDQELKTARSQFLPDVDYSSTVAAINAGRVNPLFGQSQFSATGTGTFSQLIYSESAIANIKIRSLLLEAQTYATEQQVLDITLDVMDSYLSILRAETNVLIQTENLENSKTNLELAERKVNLGAASNADVFRWRGEVATATQSVIEAQTGLFTAKAQLNALLNGAPGNDFDLQDLLLTGPLFESYATSSLAEYVQGPYELELIVEFLSQESKRNYPTKKQLLSNAEVFDRQQVLNKRLYYTPTVAAQAQMDNTFWRGGDGSEPIPGQEFPNNNWNAGLNVSIPLFDGNRRAINRQTARVQRAQVGYQIENLDRNLELSVRANTLSLLAATTNIENSRVSAENTAQNYALVQNLYKNGQINIIQLIDAQRAALQTKQAYAIAVYDYLIAFLQLENAIGSYSMLSTEEERAQFEDRWQAFLSTQTETNSK